MSGRHLAALTAGMTVGFLAGDLLPEVVDGLHEDLGMSSLAAGALTTGVLLATAIASMMFARRADRPGRVRFALAGTVVMIAGYGLAAFAPSVPSLTAAAVAAGVGAGLALAAATAGISSAADPDRASGATVLANAAVGMLLLFIVPVVSDGRAQPTFILMAVFGLLAVPLLRWLPEAPAPQAGAAATGRPGGRLPHLEVGAAMFAGALLLDMTDNGIWAFSGTIGLEDAGLSQTGVAVVFLLGGLAELLGAGTQVLLGARLGRMVPIMVLIVADSVAKVAMLLVTSPAAFTAVEVTWSFFYAALFAYLIAAGAALDRYGRWGAAMAAAFAFGDALGPLLTGVVSDTAGLTGVVVLNALVGVVAFPLLGFAAWRIDNGATRTADPVTTQP